MYIGRLISISDVGYKYWRCMRCCKKVELYCNGILSHSAPHNMHTSIDMPNMAMHHALIIRAEYKAALVICRAFVSCLIYATYFREWQWVKL
jgi:hypothetical protein